MITMYAAAKLVNTELANRGVEKKLPPQMLYTYARKGYIVTATDEKGKVRVSQVELEKWFEGYYAKLTGVKQDQVEEVAAEMAEVDEDQMTIDDILNEA